MNDTMGVSGKWIKALVGLKKSEKPESSDKDGNVSITFCLPPASSLFFLASLFPSFCIVSFSDGKHG